jgi:hypothetical protein
LVKLGARQRIHILELKVKSERRLIDELGPAGANASNVRNATAADGEGALFEQAHQHAALGNIGGLAPRNRGIKM